MPNEAVLYVGKADADLVQALLAPDLGGDRVEGAGIDGGGDVVTIVVSLGSAALTALVAIFRAYWGRARFVRIEVDGVKVEGATPEQIEAVLGKLLKDRMARDEAARG